MPDEDAVQLLVQHRFFQPDVTRIQVFNRATHPFLPVVKPHTFAVLEHLDRLGVHSAGPWWTSPVACSTAA